MFEEVLDAHLNSSGALCWVVNEASEKFPEIWLDQGRIPRTPFGHYFQRTHFLDKVPIRRKDVVGSVRWIASRRFEHWKFTCHTHHFPRKTSYVSIRIGASTSGALTPILYFEYVDAL